MKGLIVVEQQIKELYQMVQMLASLVEDLGKNVADIYKELDMVDGEELLTGYDLCDCDPNYGHICQYLHRI